MLVQVDLSRQKSSQTYTVTKNLTFATLDLLNSEILNPGCFYPEIIHPGSYLFF
jgi:hypothetical protein